MMLRFTIRDMLWLTVVVAMGVGWWAEHRRLVPTIAALKAQASQDAYQIGVERGRRLVRLYETAKYVPLKQVEVDDIVDTILHDPSKTHALQAVWIVPFFSNRAYAISFLIELVKTRSRWDEGSIVPINAIACLADMDAFEAIPAVEDFLLFL